jgi:hypothetical protein
MAQRVYDVYHIVIKEGSHARAHLDRVVKSWQPLLGQRVIQLDDHTKLAETIVSAIEVAEGVKASDSASRWGGTASNVVHAAIKDLPTSRTPKLLAAS